MEQFKDYLKRVTIFIILMLASGYIFIFAALYLKKVAIYQIQEVLMEDFLIIIAFKVIIFSLVSYTIVYLLKPIITKEKWDKNKLYIKVQILSCLAMLVLQLFLFKYSH